MKKYYVFIVMEDESKRLLEKFDSLDDAELAIIGDDFIYSIEEEDTLLSQKRVIF